MRSLSLVTLLSSAAVLALSFLPALCSATLPTVQTLNVTSYLGTWYQVYADAAIFATFEKNAVCITAQYGYINDTFVSVFNSNRDSTVTGEIKNITGYAFISDPKQPGQLSVVLTGAYIPNIPAPYWIVELGPVNANGLYDWAIVSDNLAVGLYVLTRDISTFYAKYDADVLQKLKNYGFDKFYNSPVKTTQDGCTYPWVPPVSKAMEKQYFEF